MAQKYDWLSWLFFPYKLLFENNHIHFSLNTDTSKNGKISFFKYPDKDENKSNETKKTFFMYTNKLSS